MIKSFDFLRGTNRGLLEGPGRFAARKHQTTSETFEGPLHIDAEANDRECHSSPKNEPHMIPKCFGQGHHIGVVALKQSTVIGPRVQSASPRETGVTGERVFEVGFYGSLR